jgi:hypothetical protein
MNTTDEMTTRGRARTALRTELDRQGPLHPRERALLLDAADALLFDEPDAELWRIEARALLEGLEILERRTAAEATRLRAALDGCGDGVLVPA